GRLLAGRVLDLRHHDAGRDRPDDAPGDLILYAEEVGEIAIVAVRPHVATVGRVGQLRSDPDTVALSPHAALEHVAHAELMGHLLDVDRLTAVRERRVARHHEDRPEP